MTRQNFGTADDLEVIDRLLEVDGLSLADIGCGAGRLARALAERGARVLAVEPDPVQAAENSRAAPVDGVRFVEAMAQELPARPGSLDGAIFGYSLHHIPAAEMGAALSSVIRALEPGAGFLYVIEPVMEGSYSEISRPFHDETEVRLRAIEALGRFAAPRFAEAREIIYDSSVTYESFEAFVADTVSATYNDLDREKVDTARVRALFEAGRDGESYRFNSITRVNHYRRRIDRD